MLPVLLPIRATDRALIVETASTGHVLKDRAAPQLATRAIQKKIVKIQVK